MRSDLVDVKEFESWLKKQDRETCKKIATRAALRVFPVAAHYPKNNLALLTARALLISGVAATTPTLKIISAIDAARAAAFAAADAALAARAAALAARAALAVGDTAYAAVDAASAAADAARAAVDAASAADAAARAARAADTAYADTEIPSEQLFQTPLWHGKPPPDWKLSGENLLGTSAFAFWEEWYQGFLDGKPMDWDLQREVALIPDEDWKKGAEHIARLIEEIRARFGAQSARPYQPTPQERENVTARVSMNREALALSIAGVLEQIAAFREQVRGINDLEPDYREDLLAFLDKLKDRLDALMGQLPGEGEEISEDKANGLVRWWREFTPLVGKEARAYVAPGNIAKATVPSGIILSCAGIGSMVGGPFGAGAGAFIGKLITGQVKPGKAVDDFMSSQDSPPDAG